MSHIIASQQGQKNLNFAILSLASFLKIVALNNLIYVLKLLSQRPFLNIHTNITYNLLKNCIKVPFSLVSVA